MKLLQKLHNEVLLRVSASICLAVRLSLFAFPFNPKA